MPFTRQFDESKDDCRRGQGRAVGRLVAINFLLVSLVSGCSWTAESAIRKAAAVASWGPGSTIDVKHIRPSALARTVTPWFTSSPKPSPRTELLLRKYSVLQQYQNDPDSVIRWLSELASRDPLMTEVHALAELAELQANAALQRGNRQRAVRLYSTALAHSYQFLFDPKLNVERNAYDPQFRSICDTYNRSLESMLRVVCQDGIMIPGQAMAISDDELNFEFEVRINGRWKNEQFERFELVGDYQTRGFENEYRTWGLGVPLIAVRKQGAANQNIEKYYPPGLTFPMTAFCEFSVSDIQTSELQDPSVDPESGSRRRAVLTLYDPLETKLIRAGEQIVPLQSDITTPLAYHLDDPLLNTSVLATASLLNAETTAQIHGMYMLEPYEPNKIPVVMVHGLWSSPVTWAQMFNDLRANAEIHQHYQFWFYSYSTAQPFWISARQMRRDLTQIRNELSWGSSSGSLDQMVLVGHSMGGLVSKMQTVDSGDTFWKLVSDDPIDNLEGESETLDELKSTFLFQPMPAVKRVISIATPYGGSEFANAATRWFGQKFFTLPSILTRDFGKLIDGNFQKINNPQLLSGMTSIDSLATDSPVIQQLQQASVAPDVKFHNVIGRLPKKSLLGKESAGESDGVVSVESAHCQHATSEIFVPEEHSHVHQHAACIYEVQRILLANLAELNRIRVREIPKLPVAEQQLDYFGPVDIHR